MKKISVLLVILTLLGLSACQRDTVRLSRRAREIYSGADITAAANVRADRGTEVYDFALTCFSAPDMSTVTIVEPEAVAGLTAETSGDGTELIWQDTELYLGENDSPALSPAGAMPAIFSQLRGGYCSGESLCSLGDTKAVRLDYLMSGGVWCTVYLDREGLAPLRAELGSGEDTVIFCDFTDFKME